MPQLVPLWFGANYLQKMQRDGRFIAESKLLVELDIRASISHVIIFHDAHATMHGAAQVNDAQFSVPRLQQLAPSPSPATPTTPEPPGNPAPTASAPSECDDSPTDCVAEQVHGPVCIAQLFRVYRSIVPCVSLYCFVCSLLFHMYRSIVSYVRSIVVQWSSRYTAPSLAPARHPRPQECPHPKIRLLRRRHRRSHYRPQYHPFHLARAPPGVVSSRVQHPVG